MLSFTVSPTDADTISRIAHRAHGIDRELNGRHSRKELEWRMDVTATHASGNPLRLEALAEADKFSFVHDVFGIARHLDRSTGELTSCFSPRYSQPVGASA